MRTVCKGLVGVLASISAAKASAGLVVTTYRTVARTNGYAPTSQAQYFAEQRLEDITPAVAEVFGDWTGPNADGTPNTWHFVGTSRATSASLIAVDAYRVEASASFAYQLDTTIDFVDPSSVSIFGPGGTGQYRGFFEADVPIVYTVSAQLNQLSRALLISSAGTVIFDESNAQPDPRFLTLAGTIPAGRYSLLASTGFGLGNLFSGVNHIERSGSYQNLVFTARIPEPSMSGTATAIIAGATLKRRRQLRSAGIP